MRHFALGIAHCDAVEVPIGEKRGIDFLQTAANGVGRPRAIERVDRVQLERRWSVAWPVARKGNEVSVIVVPR